MLHFTISDLESSSKQAVALHGVVQPDSGYDLAEVWLHLAQPITCFMAVQQSIGRIHS